MKNPVLFLLTALLCLSAAAQKPGKTYSILVRDEWKPTKSEYFERLDRFLSLPDSATLTDIADLYYGFSYLKAYKGAKDKTHVKAEQYYNQENYLKAWEAARKNFRKNPASLRNLRIIIYSGYYLNRSQEELRPYVYLFTGYMNVIATDRSGTSCGSGHRVVMPDDIVVYFTDHLKALNYEQRPSDTSSCYIIYYVNSDDPEGDTMYFDTSIPDLKRNR